MWSMLPIYTTFAAHKQAVCAQQNALHNQQNLYGHMLQQSGLGQSYQNQLGGLQNAAASWQNSYLAQSNAGIWGGMQTLPPPSVAQEPEPPKTRLSVIRKMGFGGK